MVATSSPEIRRMKEEAEKKSVQGWAAKKLFKEGPKERKEKKQRQNMKDAQKNSNDKTSCLYCGMQFKMSCEEWIQCTACQLWACVPCTDATKWQVDFVCDICRE